MTAVVLHRHRLPFLVAFALAAGAWLVAWLINAPMAEWATFESWV